MYNDSAFVPRALICTVCQNLRPSPDLQLEMDYGHVAM
jgi:hypothetical protein